MMRSIIEIKTVVPQDDLRKIEAVSMETQGRFRKLKIPFVSGIEFTTQLEKSDIRPFLGFSKRMSGVMAKRRKVDFPVRFPYPDRTNPKAWLIIRRKSHEPKRLSLSSCPVGSLYTNDRIRDRISSAVRQLSKTHPNVVVVDVSTPFADADDVIGALFGKPTLLIGEKTGSTKAFRGRERVYGKFNRRIGAVVF